MAQTSLRVSLILFQTLRVKSPKKQFWRAKVPASLVRSDRGTAATKPPFPVPCGTRCQFLANAGERFAQGCVLALTLFNLLCQCLLVTRSRRFIYANDILLCPPSGNFLQDRVHSDSQSCSPRQILSAVASETQHVQDCDKCFHLNNNRSRRKLNVHMNGQRLKHDPYPVCLGVTLDQTLSYREHLSRSAAKLKSRNNLITKLAGTSWGASASTLCTSALALCYSVAEYCCPVWARSSFNKSHRRPTS